MENQEIERKMEFIIEQQAQFASDMIELQKYQRNTSGMLRQTVEIVRDGFTILSEGHEQLRQEFTHVNDKIDVLVDAQIRTDEQLKLTDEQVRKNAREIVKTNRELAKTNKELAKTSKEVRRTSRAVRSLTQIVHRKYRQNEN